MGDKKPLFNPQSPQPHNKTSDSIEKDLAASTRTAKDLALNLRDLSSLQQISPAPLSALKVTVKIVKLAEKQLTRPKDLETGSRRTLEQIEGPSQWSLAKEVARMALWQQEWAAYFAYAQKAEAEA